jgi:hypothetical protein
VARALQAALPSERCWYLAHRAERAPGNADFGDVMRAGNGHMRSADLMTDPKVKAPNSRCFDDVCAADVDKRGEHDADS